MSSETFTSRRATVTLTPTPAGSTIEGPRCTVWLPACADDCHRTPCPDVGKWGIRQCRERDRRHDRDYCHSGGHLEHARIVAQNLLKTYNRTRHTTSNPTTVNYDRWRWQPLDGEERTHVRQLDHSAARRWGFWCDSPRCPRPRREGVKAPIATAEDEDEAYRLRNEHLDWHRRTYGLNGRVTLDAWILRHANITPAEPDRDEIDRQLAIARAEKAAEKNGDIT